MMVVFKMRESVPIARYSPVCNVLRQWKTSLILTYRVYRLYDMYKNCSSLATMILWIQEVGNNYGSQVYRNVPVMSAFKHVSLKKQTLPSPGAYVSNE